MKPNSSGPIKELVLTAVIFTLLDTLEPSTKIVFFLPPPLPK